MNREEKLNHLAKEAWDLVVLMNNIHKDFADIVFDQFSLGPNTDASNLLDDISHHTDLINKAKDKVSAIYDDAIDLGGPEYNK